MRTRLPLWARCHQRIFGSLHPLVLPALLGLQFRVFDPTLVFLVTTLVAMIAIAIKLRWGLSLRLSLLIGSLTLICKQCHPLFFRLDDKKLPIFFQQPVDNDRRRDVVLGFENADLDIVSRWCTVEKHTDVVGIRDRLALFLDLSLEAFHLLKVFLHIAVVIHHLCGVELSLQLA